MNTARKTLTATSVDAAMGRRMLNDSLFKNLMTWVGSRSYAIYLIHIPAFYLSRELCFRLGWDAGERPLSLFLAVPPSDLSRTRPLMRRWRVMGGWKGVPGSVMARG